MADKIVPISTDLMATTQLCEIAVKDGVFKKKGDLYSLTDDGKRKAEEILAKAADRLGLTDVASGLRGGKPPSKEIALLLMNNAFDDMDQQ